MSRALAEAARMLVEMPIRIPNWFTRDFKPEPAPFNDEYRAMSSREIGDSLHHHVYAMKESPEWVHILSRSSTPPDPNDDAAVVASALVHRVPFTSQDPEHPWNGHHVSVIKYIAVNKSQRGNGIGRALYQAIVAHDQRVQSDRFVAPGAHRTWKSVGKDPKFKVSLAPYNWWSRTRHEAEYQGPPVIRIDGQD